jgi:hypothetical protein
MHIDQAHRQLFHTQGGGLHDVWARAAAEQARDDAHAAPHGPAHWLPACAEWVLRVVGARTAAGTVPTTRH